MSNLGISRDEAIQLIKDDLRIDQGEKLFTLDPELEAGSKKARQTSTGERKPRERKPNDNKRFLISALINAVDTECEIANEEREFSFTYNGTKYKVVLSCPRT